MRLVISGGSGLIGRHLVAGLVRDEHEVVVLTRSPGEHAGLSPRAREVAWDAATVGPWAGELEGADAVVHLAGAPIASGRWTPARKRRIRDSRVASGGALAAACAELSAPPRVFVQASAVGFYGARGDEVIDEASTPGEGFLAETCREWEASTAAVEALGARRPILRTGVVLARDGGALPLMKRPFELFVGGPLGDGAQWMPWIHLVDEVAAIRFLIDHPAATGPFDLTAPNPVTNGELSATLARVLGRPNLLRAPGFAIRTLLGEMSEAVLTGQRAVPRRLLELGFEFRFPSLEPALRDLLG